MKVCLHCDSKVHAKGLCAKHYQAAHYLANRKHEPRSVMTPEERKASAQEARRRYRARNPGAASASTRKWLDAHPEYRQIRATRQLAYASTHREQERLRAEKWRAENKERHAATKRAYYVRNADEVRAKIKAYRKENLQRYRAYSREYKAAKRAGGGRLSRGCVSRLLNQQNGRCVVCSCDLRDSGYHIDHIVALARGGKHCDENVQLLCPTCNRRKSDRDFAEFLAIVESERE